MHKKGQFIVRRRAALEEGVKIWKTQTGTFYSPQAFRREEIIHPFSLAQLDGAVHSVMQCQAPQKKKT